MTLIESLLLVFLLLLLLSMLLGLVRAMLGPTLEDRLAAAQLLGTTGIGFLMLASQVLPTPGLIDVSLILALLAVVAAAAMTRREADGD